MTKPCVVPNCRTGYQSEKSKRSVFRVPKDVERLKLWISAIPGIEKLKESHVVCDKHFKNEYIIRHWIHRDADGRIIAQVPYKYPKLSELAVPSIFEDDAVKKAFGDLSSEFIKEPAVLEKDSGCLAQDVPIDPPDGYKYVETQSLEKSDPNLTYEFIEPHGESIDKETPTENIAMTVSSISENERLPSPKEIADGDSVTPISIVAIHRNRSITVESVDKAIENASRIALPISTDVRSASPKEIPNIESGPPPKTATVNSRKRHSSAANSPPNAREKPFSVRYCVTSNQSIEKSATVVSSDENSCQLPQSWSVTELPRETGQLLIFSYMVTKLTDEIYTPVAQRCVTLDTEKNVRYFIYGRTVSPLVTRLSRTLDTIDSLPKLLQNFQWMNICNGLGDVKGQRVSTDNAFLDYVQQWRDNNCSMLTGLKRCEFCTRLRRRYRAPSIIPSSPDKQKQKLAEIRNINRMQIRKTKRAEIRVQMLMGSLKKKEELLARVQEETLDEKCSKLNVSESQKAAIKKVIAAASRCS